MDTMNYDRLSTFRRRNWTGPDRIAPPSARAIRPRPGAPQ